MKYKQKKEKKPKIPVIERRANQDDPGSNVPSDLE